MANLQWLKLSTNFFDNNKIKLLEGEKDGDTLIRVWIQLLTIAMKCNYQGRLSITEEKPMTVDEFSKIMGKSKKKITKCLEKFEELKMIIIEDNFYKIKNWSKYQSADKLEEIRLQNCLRQQKYREKKKSEKEKSNVTVTQRNTKEEKKIRNKIEKEGDENSNYKIITNEGAKCGFCNKDLKPIGFDYLYVNYDKSMIEYERCNCEKAVQFWKEFDLEQEEKQRQEEYKKIINSIYKDNYMKKRLQKYNFENVSDTYEDTFIINQLIKFTDLCIESEMKNGLIIYGNIGYEKTYLAACIANKMIEQNKIVLMEKSSSIIDKIKESFNKDGLSETQIIRLYSNVDMLIIDDFGSENLSKWALEKLNKIISNRYDNELPIVITTRYNKEQLIEQLSTEDDTEISEEIVEVLNEMCYGISIAEEIKAKEKVSISDQTIC